MEVAKMVISDASNKLTRREIGERLCMILCSFVSSDRRCDQLQNGRLEFSLRHSSRELRLNSELQCDLWKFDVALLRAFDHFHCTRSRLRSWGCCFCCFRRRRGSADWPRGHSLWLFTLQ